MSENAAIETEFRKQLVAALNGAQGGFNFDTFVSESRVPRDIADRVAEKLLAQVIVRSLEDRTITDEERQKSDKVARLLEISPERQKQIFERAGEAKYRSSLAKAKADGQVTDQERAELQQLLTTLGYQADNSPGLEPQQWDGAPADQPRPSPTPTPSIPAKSFDDAELGRTLRYEVNDTADSVLADMDYLRQFDHEQEKKARLWQKRGWIGIAAIPLAAITCLMLPNPILLTLGLMVGVSGLVGAIAAFVLSASNSRLDLEDRRYEVVAGLLRLLSKDMAADALVTVQVDFRPHNAESKLLRRGKVGYWNVKFFQDAWLSIQGRLLDGTKYSITMIEKQQERHRTKRVASGKTKHKHKNKRSAEAIVSLKIKEKRYARTQQQDQSIREGLQLPNWALLKSVTAQGDVLTLRSTSQVAWDASKPDQKNATHDGVQWVAMMFLSLYRVLNSSKT